MAATALELWQTEAHGLPVYFPVPLFFLSWNATAYCGRSTNEKHRNFIAQVLGKRYQASNKIKPGSHNSRTVSLWSSAQLKYINCRMVSHSPHFLPEMSKSMAPYSAWASFRSNSLYSDSLCYTYLIPCIFFIFIATVRKQFISPFGSRAKDYWANDHVQGSGQCFRLVAGGCRRWWCWECGARHRFQGVGSGYSHASVLYVEN